MKGKQAVLDDIKNNLGCLRNIVPLTLEGQEYRLKFVNHLEEMEIFIHSLTEEKALEFVRILEEYDQHFGHRREPFDMLHIINRVLDEPNALLIVTPAQLLINNKGE